MTEFNTSQLFLSKRLGEVRIDPCCLFQIDDYLPDDFYQALRETFPDESTYQSDDSKKMGFRSSVESDPFDAFCDANPVSWEQTDLESRSNRFLKDIAKRIVRNRAIRAVEPRTALHDAARVEQRRGQGLSRVRSKFHRTEEINQLTPGGVRVAKRIERSGLD